MSWLRRVDPDVWQAIEDERRREGEKIVLIASENYASPAVLEAQGVAPFDSHSQPFDPVFHQVVAVTEKDGVESGTVVGEVTRGYRWGDEVLRPARVLVAR